ncbi:HAD family hydrolase [Rhodoferax sp. TBRC 17660]|uniref:HAD family hydrolase n=1 Tax=Rhodoferax potami TaxID=3068338 RepID=A0ABU3KJB9_9BURK|nr:HAD family hydrolase [Rhodoferax sp. TBRC 17660]MDT7517522.1 HAD family hydrolase [Rhodoferax sp. TBRC 17660]
MLNLSRIRAITLDLDDTLWPVWPAIHRAEDLLREWLTAHAPRTAVMYADPHQRQLLRADTEAQWADHAHDLSVLRRESIRLALQRSGDDSTLAEPAFEVFFDARMQVELFEDAIPLLDAMAARWPIVAVSNGNADVHRVGIGRYFAASVSARDAGVGKPDPRIFAAACASVGVKAEEVLHIGDDAALDVLGALGVGMQTVWVNREEHLWSFTQYPHATVGSLRELQDLLSGPAAA